MQVGINQSPQRYYHSNKFQSTFQKSPNYFVPNNQFRQPQHASQGGQGNIEFDGKRLRKAVSRRTVDYNTVIVKYLEARSWQRDVRDRRAVQPDVGYYTEILPPMSMLENPVNAITTKFVRTSTNKMRCPIFCVAWTPEGRRLITGASSGEFTLWNGLTFNFETILQAHDSPVRCMVWSHNDTWMVTGDHSGYVKYWQSNMNNVKMFQAHKEPLRGISFCPTDTKFVTCSDDGTVRIWDFLRCSEEKILRGHGADVKCVAWHPQKSLIVSGSKDSQQPIKLWDPKSGTSLATIHAHKSTVMEVKWNQNGNWMLTASRDHLLKLFDIRNLSQEIQTFRGHKKEACSISWHPIHDSMFVSGGSDGSVMFWVVGAEKEVGGMEQAHDSCVWSLAWHPLGHILCTGSNDHTSKFWTRNRPGDRMRDRYNLNTLPKGLDDTNEYDDVSISSLVIPGMGLEMAQAQADGSIQPSTLAVHPLGELNTSPQLQKPNPEHSLAGIPGLDFSEELGQGDKQEQQQAQRKVPFSKPIPRQFQQCWMENKQPLLLAPPAINPGKDDNFPPQPGGPDLLSGLPNMMGAPNSMGPPIMGMPPNAMGGPPMGGPPNHMGGPPMGGPPMGGPPNLMGGPPNLMGGPPNLMGGPPMGGPPMGGPPMGGPPNQMGGPPNQMGMGGPPNQMGMGGPPNQMGMGGPPNQMGMGGPNNQMGRHNQMGGPDQMGRPDQMGGLNQMGRPDQMGGPNQMGRPDQMGGPNQMGRPDQMGGPNQMGRPDQMGGPNQMGRPNQMGGPNQMGMPGPPNQMQDGPPFGPRGGRTSFSTHPNMNQRGPNPNNQRGPPNQMQGGPTRFGHRGGRSSFVTSHPMQGYQEHQQGGPPNNPRGPLLQRPGGFGGGGPPPDSDSDYHQQRGGDFEDDLYWNTRDIVPHGNDQQQPPFHNNNNNQQHQQERWFQRTKNNY